MQAETGEYIPPPIAKFSLRELREAYPELQPPVIDGLLREGEVANIIAAPKVGKSWLVYYIAWCIVMGFSLFERFKTSPGRVLLVDNELHRGTLAHRPQVVAEAMGLDPFGDDDRYLDDLEIWPLRGDLRSLHELLYEFEQLERGTYKAIVFDAKYRFGNGESENDNQAETQLYNLIDRIADMTGAAIILVHHASKGNQSGKSVTDTGAGAGAQSRAADCHLVLREHEEPGHIVLDGVVRSFPPVSPVVLKWQFPLWVPAEGMDPSELKGTKTKAQEQQEKRDHDGKLSILAKLDGKSLTNSDIRKATGMGADRVNRLIALLLEEGRITETTTEKSGNECTEYSIA